MLRLSSLILSSLLAATLPVGCVYDPDQRCGPHQRYLEPDRCECIDGYIPAEEGCEPCGENERESNGACVCVDGYARASNGARCEEIPGELGVDCDTEDTPCPAGRYPLCQVVDGTSGYCTNACSEDGDCDGGYKCHQAGADSFCRRPPLGYGQSCQTREDCKDGEATYCDTIQSHLCLVPCSAGNTSVCFEGESCCDFKIFEPICVPSDACGSSGGTVLE